MEMFDFLKMRKLNAWFRFLSHFVLLHIFKFYRFYEQVFQKLLEMFNYLRFWSLIPSVVVDINLIHTSVTDKFTNVQENRSPKLSK